MMAFGPDWLPTLVAIWISKTYFSAFLKESGKDHSKILTQALINLSKKMFYSEQDAAIVNTSGKITHPKLYSILYSIWTVADKCSVKFVFNTKHSEREYISNMKAVLRFLEAFYSDNILTEDEPIVDAIRENNQIVVAYDPHSDSLYLV